MISKNDQKRLEIFKNRTVVNGNTLAEEQEAKKQIGKILSNYEGDYEYIPDIGYVNNMCICLNQIFIKIK